MIRRLTMAFSGRIPCVSFDSTALSCPGLDASQSLRSSRDQEFRAH